jgi:hypothetical protein
MEALGRRSEATPALHPLPFGGDMSDGLPGGTLHISCRVLDLDGNPLPGATLDVWQADADGFYESQLPDVDEQRLRATFSTLEDGRYCIARSRRAATLSRWTGPWATSCGARRSATSTRPTCTFSSTFRAMSG